MLQIAENMKGENVKFIIAGNYETSIIVPENVILLGHITDQKELAKYYSMADVTLLTSSKETFSMVTAESLCCGTPVVGFKAGAPEQIAVKEYSRFVEFGDIEHLEHEVKVWLTATIEKEKIAQAAAEVYSREKMVRGYIGLYHKLIDKI